MIKRQQKRKACEAGGRMSLQAKCDLAASCRALSLHFSSLSRELKQKAANPPHLALPSRGWCCVSQCGEPLPGVSFAPQQTCVSAGGTLGSGAAAGCTRQTAYKS